MRVEQEIPNHPAVERLFELADAASLALYPGQTRTGPSTAALRAQEVRFFVARVDWDILGCAGYVPAGNACAEVKRLLVHESVRRQGIGRMLLNAVEDLARLERFTLLRLETGMRAAAAIALYRAAGYRPTAPFGAHAADPMSVFMEKPLNPARPPDLTPP